jgi:hypothetical protein
MLQPSSCQLHSCQSADDCDKKRDKKRVDNSSSDDHNDVDVNNSYWRNDRDDNCSDLDFNDSNDHDVCNCY